VRERERESEREREVERERKKIERKRQREREYIVVRILCDKRHWNLSTQKKANKVQRVGGDLPFPW
jgi:hypothetical protein